MTFLILLSLTLRAHGRGYKDIWAASISELGWFDEESGQNENSSQQQMYYTPVAPQGQQQQQQGSQVMYPNTPNYGPNPVFQLPGHSVVITNGPNGQISE